MTTIIPGMVTKRYSGNKNHATTISTVRAIARKDPIQWRMIQTRIIRGPSKMILRVRGTEERSTMKKGITTARHAEAR